MRKVSLVPRLYPRSQTNCSVTRGNCNWSEYEVKPGNESSIKYTNISLISGLRQTKVHSSDIVTLLQWSFHALLEGIDCSSHIVSVIVAPATPVETEPVETSPNDEEVPDRLVGG